MGHKNMSLLGGTGLTARLNPPTITPPLVPATGVAAGGTAVTIHGTNFRKSSNPAVTFGGTPATAVVVVDATTITCVSPAHATGAVAVAVTNAAGGDGHGQTVSSAGAFTYT